jgi:hypothetical protein
MTGTSLAGILIIVAVAVAGLVVWLGLVFWAGRHPYFKRSTLDQRRGDVRGGRFVGKAAVSYRVATLHPIRAAGRDRVVNPSATMIAHLACGPPHTTRAELGSRHRTAPRRVGQESWTRNNNACSPGGHTRRRFR